MTRPKDVQDNAVPSGNAMAARVLLRLAAWTGEGAYRDAAERAMRAVVPFVDRYPTGFAQWLVGDGPRAGAGGRGRDRRRAGRPGDGRSAGRGPARLPAEPGRVGGGRPGRERRAVAAPTGSRSTAGRRPTSAAASSAACRSPTAARSCAAPARGSMTEPRAVPRRVRRRPSSCSVRGPTGSRCC